MNSISSYLGAQSKWVSDGIWVILTINGFYKVVEWTKNGF